MNSPEHPIVVAMRACRFALVAACLFSLLCLVGPLAAEAPSSPAKPGHSAAAAYAFVQAKLLADAGDFEGALGAYEQAVALDPGDPYSLIELARFQVYLAQIARSPAYQKQLVEEAAKTAGRAKTAAPENTDVLETYGQVHMRLGELDPTSASLPLAQGAFELLRQKEPQDLPVLLSLGQLYLWQQDAPKAVEVLEEAAKTSPGHRMVLNMLVEAQLAAAENDGAIDTLRQLLKVEPANPEHRIRLAELLSNRGEHLEAVSVLENAPPEMATSQRARQILARELHFSGRNQEALVLVDELSSRFPDHEGMHRLRAAILSGLTRYREAIAELAPLVERELDPERRSQDTLLLARLKERVGDGAGAAKLVEDALGNFPGANRTEGIVALAGILERSGQAEESARRLREALPTAQGQDLVAIGGALAEVLNGLGRADEALELYSDLRRRLGDVEEAEPLAWRQVLLAAAHKKWQEVLDFLPGLVMAEDRPELEAARFQLRVTAMAGLGEVDSALELLRGKTPLTGLQLLAKRLEILEEAGRQDDLNGELSRLSASSDPQDLRFVVQIFQRFERYGEAVTVYEKLLKTEDTPDLHFGLAVSLERSGQREKAVQLFEQIVAKDPDQAGALNYLGYMWAEHGENLDRALELILRAVALEPDNGAYVDSLGWAYYQLGRYAEAREQLEWAVRLVGNDSTLHEHLASVYEKLGEKAKAEKALAEAGELEDEPGRKVELQKQLEALKDRNAGS